MTFLRIMYIWRQSVPLLFLPLSDLVLWSQRGVSRRCSGKSSASRTPSSGQVPTRAVSWHWGTEALLWGVRERSRRGTVPTNGFPGGWGGPYRKFIHTLITQWNSFFIHHLSIYFSISFFEIFFVFNHCAFLGVRALNILKYIQARSSVGGGHCVFI